MNKSLMKQNILLKMINNMLIVLPSPININYMWNFGSMLGLMMLIQVITGLFLSMYYVSNIKYSFMSVIYLMQNVNYGWIIRMMHMNGASIFFMLVYLHIGRGLYYGSYKLCSVWIVGVMIYLLMMMIAFLGYVLPWGQMSFWGATVITNLISVIPKLGESIVEWVWGGFSVSNETLGRFYSFHFFFPFILIMLIGIHLMYLHEKGSNNPLGVNSNFMKIMFHSYFTIKDLLWINLMFLFYLYIIFIKPYMLGDPDNFNMANSMITPIHIQPEWYFLFAYSILRSIPNKLSGVLLLMMSILTLLLVSKLNMNLKFQSLVHYPINKMLFWMFVFNLMILTWLGGQSVEYPFILISQICMIFHFMYFIMDSMLKKLWNNFFMK